MKQFDVYVVRLNTDNIEGRGPMYDGPMFTDHQDAVRASIGMGPMGSVSAPVETKRIIIFDSYGEYTVSLIDRKIRATLEKLTDDEMNLLEEYFKNKKS